MLGDVVYFPLDNVQLRFRDALKQVYEANLFPAHDRSMKYELEYGDSKMDLVVGSLFNRHFICAFFCYKSAHLLQFKLIWSSFFVVC